MAGFTYEAAFEVLEGLEGQKVRLVYRVGINGRSIRTGVVGFRAIGVHRVLTLDGSTVMGELAGSGYDLAAIESKSASTGRFEIVARSGQMA